MFVQEPACNTDLTSQALGTYGGIERMSTSQNAFAYKTEYTNLDLAFAKSWHFFGPSGAVELSRSF